QDDTNSQQDGSPPSSSPLPLDAIGTVLDTKPPPVCTVLGEATKAVGPIIDPNCKPQLLQTLSGVAQLAGKLGLVTAGVVQDIITVTLDGGAQPESGGLAPLTAGSPGLTSSMFMVSGYKALSHDGFSSSSQFGSDKTPGFDEKDYGLTIGTRFDGSKLFDAPAQSVTLGVLANYTHTDIDVGASPFAPGLSKSGSAKVDSFSVGGFGLATDGRKYGLLTVVGTFGSPDTESTAILPANASFNNFGIATSAVGGVILPVGDSKLDLRGGIDYVYATVDDYTDSNGFKYTDARLDQLSGSVSARLFRIIRTADYTMRPFVQTGVNQRLHYDNELKIDSVEYSFDDAATSVFARAGVDFDVGSSTQAYMAVRGDASEDMRAIAAQIGVTFKLD
ncbi:MAG: autotransporter outer membrane beta-barrel domain-containing protein, partial [Rhodomicrobiaceae bacterium]